MPLFRKEKNYTFSSALTKVFTQARGADRRRHRPARAEPPPGRVRRLRPARRLHLLRRHDRRARLHLAALEPVRAPSCWVFRNYYGKDVQTEDDDRARVAVGALRPRPVARQREADAEPRPAPRVLPADDARGQRHRAARLRHLHGAAGRPRRRARGRRASSCKSCTWPRAWAPCTGSTRRRWSAPATAAPSTRCPGRGRCAAPSRTTSSSTSRPSSSTGPRRSPRASRRCRCPTSARAGSQLPVGVFMRIAEARPTVDRARTIQQWNVAFEQRLPCDLVGRDRLRRHGDRRRLRGPQHQLRRAGRRQRRPEVLRASPARPAINDWGARTKSRYNGLQMALNRPFQNGLLLKGAYTLSQAKNMTDEDGWVGLTWNHPLKYDDNFALAGYDRTHVVPDGLRCTSCRSSRTTRPRVGTILGGWQVNGIVRVVLRHAVLDQRHQQRAELPGLRLDLHQRVRAIRSRPATSGRRTRPWYDKSAVLAADGHRQERLRDLRAQPVPPAGGVEPGPVAVQGVPGRARAARSCGSRSATCSTTRTGARRSPTYTANNFMQFTPASTNQTSTVSGDLPGARRVQIGLRVAF